MRRLVCAAAVLSLLLVACGGGSQEHVEIGIKRSALELVFKGEEAGKVAPLERLGPQAAPAFAGFVSGARPGSLGRGSPLAAGIELCPKAPKGAVPAEPVTALIGRAPAAGTYTFHNTGTYEIDGLFKLKGEYPPFTAKKIDVVKAVGDERFRFDVVQSGLAVVTTTTYAVTDTALQLIRLHIKTDDDDLSFEPTPPVTLLELPAEEGATWTSAGVDPDTGTSMVVDGRIESREAVDVCGKVYSTYRVISDETIVNVVTGFRHETNEPTVYNIATHLGGLFLREDANTTTYIPTSTGFVIAHLDYVSTMNAVTPLRSP